MRGGRASGLYQRFPCYRPLEVNKDFSDEVNAIVEDALAGRLPIRGDAESG